MHQPCMMHPFSYTLTAPRLIGGEQEPIADLECVAAIIPEPSGDRYDWRVETITVEVWVRNPSRPVTPNGFDLITLTIDEEHPLRSAVINFVTDDLYDEISAAWTTYLSEGHREYDSHAA